MAWASSQPIRQAPPGLRTSTSTRRFGIRAAVRDPRALDDHSISERQATSACRGAIKAHAPPQADTQRAPGPAKRVSASAPMTVASDDQQARKVRLLLLGKGVVSAHRIERPLAARLDEYEQRPASDAGRDARRSFYERRLRWPGAHACRGLAASVSSRLARARVVSRSRLRYASFGAETGRWTRGPRPAEIPGGRHRPDLALLRASRLTTAI